MRDRREGVSHRRGGFYTLHPEIYRYTGEAMKIMTQLIPGANPIPNCDTGINMAISVPLIWWDSVFLPRTER